MINPSIFPIPADQVFVRRAVPADIPGISRLVITYARSGELLPRSLEAITETIDDWVVGIHENDVIGCGSLLLYEPTLAEVRSLAVAPVAKGLGLGKKIVTQLIAEARARDIRTLFALTRAVPFFQRMGFHVTEKENFPQKVWTDCHICPLRDHCDETAVVMNLAAGV